MIKRILLLTKSYLLTHIFLYLFKKERYVVYKFSLIAYKIFQQFCKITFLLTIILTEIFSDALLKQTPTLFQFLLKIPANHTTLLQKKFSIAVAYKASIVTFRNLLNFASRAKKYLPLYQTTASISVLGKTHPVARGL